MSVHVHIYVDILDIFISNIYIKMNETITAEGIIEFHDSMAECEGKESMKCSFTDFLCCLPPTPLPDPKVIMYMYM